MASVRAAAAGLQVESPSLSRVNGGVVDPWDPDSDSGGGADALDVMRTSSSRSGPVEPRWFDIQLTLGVTTYRLSLKPSSGAPL